VDPIFVILNYNGAVRKLGIRFAMRALILALEKFDPTKLSYLIVANNNDWSEIA